MVSIDDMSFEHDDAQSNCMVCLDIDPLVQENGSENFDKYIYVWRMCDNNIPLKHCKHSEAFEEEEQGDNGKEESQSDIGDIQPGKQHSMHIEERLEVKP